MVTACTMGSIPSASARLRTPSGEGGRHRPRKSLFMIENIPDRLSTNPRSPHYNEALLKRGVGVRFNGVEKTNVDEYCVSEGWIRVAAGKSLDRKGNPMTILLRGAVEPYFRAELS